ncbi:uncharacterized protein [Maniola hyperantus]|uniref:uncharacterized protein n=1 Tax=Aphantopus hyperantus TaxID=2795564 RepID=UPI00374A77AC
MTSQQIKSPLDNTKQKGKTGTGTKDNRVSRRLLGCTSRCSCTTETCKIPYRLIGEVGLVHQLPKIKNNSKHTAYLSRRPVGHQKQHKRTPGGEIKRTDENNQHHTKKENLVLENSKNVTRKTEFRSIYGTKGEVAFKTHSNKCESITREQTIPKICYSKGRYQRVTVVARPCSRSIPNSHEEPNGLHDNRCSRRRMGGIGEFPSSKRLMGPYPEILAQQSKGTLGGIRDSQVTGVQVERGISNVTNRQQNSRCLLDKAGGNKINQTLKNDICNIRTTEKIQHTSLGSVSPRSIQWNRRQSVSLQSIARVAPEQGDNTSNIPEIRSTAGRFVCLKGICSGECICVRRRSGSGSPIHRCFHKDMALQASICLSSSGTDTQSFTSPRQLHGKLSAHCTQLGKNFLAANVETEGRVSPNDNSQFREPLNRSPDGEATPSSRVLTIAGMENTEWSNLLRGWPQNNIKLLEASWRRSTQKTYKHAWDRWLQWCTRERYSPRNPSVTQLAQYLGYLHNEIKLAPKTILLHKSVVVNFANTEKAELMNNHPVIKHILKGIQLIHPSVGMPAIWPIGKLINYLNEYTINTESLFEVSQHLAAILLLASGRRVHDLTLLKMDNNSLVDHGSELTLWPQFGSKTDRAEYRQSGWRIIKSSNPKLDLVTWVRTQVEKSSERRASHKEIYNLFITTRGKVKNASRTVIAGWIRTLLKEAGIHGPSGSFRAAVASDILYNRHESIDDILKRGNWKSENTVFKHYFREISPMNVNRARNNPLLSSFTPI